MKKTNCLIRFRSKKEEVFCVRKFIVMDPETKLIIKDKNGPIADADACVAASRAEKAGFKVVGHVSKPNEKIYMLLYFPHKDDKFPLPGRPFVKEFKDGSVLRGFQPDEKRKTKNRKRQTPSSYDREKADLFDLKRGLFKTPSLGEIIHALDPYATDLDELDGSNNKQEVKNGKKENGK